MNPDPENPKTSGSATLTKTIAVAPLDPAGMIWIYNSSNK
jgi:hypothetical protein